LEVQGGTNYVIKNNIFANNGGGYAAYYMGIPAAKDIDYNNYFSKGNNFANLNGQLFNNLTQWGIAINGDANSKHLNPNFKSDTALLPFQKQFNGAGISSGNILLDIDGELRNQQAPDIGAQEFMVDFGVTRLVSPTNECKHSVTTPVTVYLRQFGDIPFIDLKLAYQINGGPIFYDTIPGSISNDLEYTFNRPQDLSLNGTYIFKIWLVDNGDDNLNNDTLVVTRKNKDAPVVDFSYISQCSGLAVPFTGTATIASGFIDRLEWEFGDSTLGVGYTPSHIYDTSGAYTVTMRAFSDQGCYSEVKKVINLKPTPLANFTAKDVCFGVPLKPINTTTIQPGATITGYNWSFGDGSTSTLKDPTHQYSQADTFNVKLVVSASNGCIDSITKPVISYAFENSAYKFRKPLQNYICEGTSLKLAASGAVSYQWLFNGQPIDGAKDSIYLATKAGKYAVIFVNPLGCRSSASDSVVLKVVKKPEAKFTYDSYCVGTPIQFKETSERDTTVAYTFTWDFGDNSPKVLGSTQTHTYSKSGEYKAFMYLSSTACANHADTTYENIKVETPLKGKRYEDVAVLQGKSKKLEARDFGVKYLWTPATQLDNPNIKEPTVKAEKEQLYQVSITSKSGCVTVDTVKVVLFDKCDIKAPEGFSPNDDGNNDRFYPFKIGIKTMKLFRIYDRFGNLVYDNKNATNADGWDGKKDGKKLPVGVYVWVAEGTGEDDQPIKRSGNVILVK
jgi:gliding motility-associated-like protein